MSLTPLTFLALGDSYTIGTGVSQAESWPLQLAARLRTANISVDNPQVIAVNGWKTTDLMRGITNTPTHPPYNLVTLLIGVNNQYNGLSLDAYAQDFTSLLDQAIQFAGGDPGKVIVVTIPDWGVTAFASGQNQAEIGAQIDQFNQTALGIAKQAGVSTISVTEISRQAGDKPGMLARDGLHPSGEQYALWVDAIYPLAQTILSQSSQP